MSSVYKKTFDLEHRKNEYKRVKNKYPNRIPVILEGIELPMNKRKYLIPHDITFSEFTWILRGKKLQLKPEEAIFLFVNNTLIPSNTLLSSVYGENKDEDGFLYVVITKESTFG